MYRDRINEERKVLKISIKTMSERSELHLPEETISRFLSSKTHESRVSTMLDVGKTVGLEPYELFMDARTAAEFKLFLETRSSNTNKDEEINTLLTQNVALKDDIAALKAENELLRLKLEHKEEIISLHNYYKSVISGMTK